ncbi:unnamed protein product [Rotaria socialis]|uniref:Uncharacterized protein n=1 Tax=Rotaria socialis TaxID=392032 RepID=A0A820WVS7_9BILA|nr:unnamed protein product [Rotaria socialis]CAF4522770.1 unnamed protein product [Rotaria socialis]
MVHRRNSTQSRHHLSIKKNSRLNTGVIQQTSSSSTISMVKQNSTENLDDETKLAKRHLTKEMWQLVSIAVKRMADELVSISNNQQAATRILNIEPPTPIIFNNHQTKLVESNSIHQQSSSTPIIQEQTMSINSGAGDLPCMKENAIIFKEPTKKRTLPIQMFESPLQIKKKGISNNASRRPIKSKTQNKSSSKKNGKIRTPHLRNNHKLK